MLQPRTGRRDDRRESRFLGPLSGLRVLAQHMYSDCFGLTWLASDLLKMLQVTQLVAGEHMDHPFHADGPTSGWDTGVATSAAGERVANISALRRSSARNASVAARPSMEDSCSIQRS